MARLADSVMVCMGGGDWYVWGRSRRFPDPAEVGRAEAILRGLWKEKVAVPAYNYGSWQGCKEYVPWCQWRADRRPTLDSPCFTTDYAAMDRRIYAKADEDGEEQEDDDDAQVRQVRGEGGGPAPHRDVGRLPLPLPCVRPVPDGAEPGEGDRGGGRR